MSYIEPMVLSAADERKRTPADLRRQFVIRSITPNTEEEMQKYIVLAVVAPTLCIAPVFLAQSHDGSATRRPEHDKLALFVGKWAVEADFKPSDTNPGGKSKWTELCEWVEGDYALMCHSVGDFGGHPFKEISVTAFDETEGTYVYFETNNNNQNDLWRGKMEDDTWTWNKKGIAHGKPTEMRFTQRLSADSIAFRLESTAGDTTFKLVMDGKQTRQK